MTATLVSCADLIHIAIDDGPVGKDFAAAQKEIDTAMNIILGKGERIGPDANPTHVIFQDICDRVRAVGL